MRDRGSLAREVEAGSIENVYRLQIMNATESVQRFHVAVAGLPESVIVSQPDVDVQGTDSRWLAVRVQIPFEAAQKLGPGVHPLHFQITRSSDAAPAAPLSEKTTFIVPK